MKNILDIETTYIPHLRSQFLTGSLVLFTGAGFSLDGVNIAGDKIPSAYKLTKMLWGICFPDDEFEEDTQLQDIYDTALAHHTKELKSSLGEIFSADAKNSPDWYSELLSMPWLRAYTLNIDNLIEQVSSVTTLARETNSISAMTDLISKISSNKLDVIHLNGSTDDLPNNVTFSRSQYAERIGKDPFYQQLRADILSRPVVFIGSSLEEGPLWEHLIARGKKGSRMANELRPRSYLVLPSLNKSKQAMLSKYNIAWLEMTGEDFCKEIISEVKESSISGFEALKNRGIAEGSGHNKILLVSDLSSKKAPQTEYLLGDEPTWSDIYNSRAAERECFFQSLNEVNKLRAEPIKRHFIVITGTAGSGKSTMLMWTALQLQSDGVIVGWLDSNTKLSMKEFSKSISEMTNLGALLINDADIYGNQLSTMIRTALDYNKNLLILIETRSNKVDRIIRPYELANYQPKEIVMPNLTDSDIDNIIEVLDKENRLGVLKGETHSARKLSFSKTSSRQLLVAMYEATSGKLFADRAADEMSTLDDSAKLVYALVSTASAYRFSLSRDEVLIACSDPTNESLNQLNSLVKRKLIHSVSGATEFVRARHRVIANLVYNSLVQDGRFERVLKGLLQIGVAKVSQNSDHSSRPVRMLRTFINHNFIKRAVSIEAARTLYSDFEDVLSWDSHYWLHRGALELESNQLSNAENFLGQALSLRPDDLFIQNEWAYLLFKKALNNPLNIDSKELIDEAIILLEAIILKRKDQSAHAYHVLCSQGLQWSQYADLTEVENKEFLLFLESKINEAIKIHPHDSVLADLHTEVRRAVLRLAL